MSTWSPTPGSLCLRCTLPPSPTQTVAARLHLPGCLFLLGGCPFQKGCLSSQCASYWSSLGQACGYVSSSRWTRLEVFFSICWPSVVARGRGGRCSVRKQGQVAKSGTAHKGDMVLVLERHHGQHAEVPSRGDTLQHCSRRMKDFLHGKFQSLMALTLYESTSPFYNESQQENNISLKKMLGSQLY